MSSTFTSEELKLLPEWVREKIAMLERENRESKEDITNLCKALDYEGAPLPGAVEMDPAGRNKWLVGRAPRCLPPGTAVAFHLEGGSQFQVRLTKEFQLEVRTNYRFLAVRPHSANQILIDEVNA